MLPKWKAKHRNVDWNESWTYVTFGIDNNNPTIDNLTKSGLKVSFRPIDGAITIGKQNGSCFTASYLEKKSWLNHSLMQKKLQWCLSILLQKTYSNCFIWLHVSRSMVCGHTGWHNFKDAKANYLWSNVAGTGSIGLSFEQVLEKPKRQTLWYNRTL
jgi:iron complex transport system substrate-binding protein